tara:strand:+ start:452 stop:892 length:441 start_codon:yes stop_codon:yes gene_type:complete
VGKVSSVRTQNEMGNSNSSGSSIRTGRSIWLTIAICCGAIGCTTIKKAGIVGLGAGVGAIAGTALSGGVIAPILGATTTAFVTDVVTEAIPIGNKTMNDCAPDNFWSLLGSLIEMGGWALILIVLVPMVFSWLMPGPVQFKKKNGS